MPFFRNKVPLQSPRAEELSRTKVKNKNNSSNVHFWNDALKGLARKEKENYTPSQNILREDYNVRVFVSLLDHLCS